MKPFRPGYEDKRYSKAVRRLDTHFESENRTGKPTTHFFTLKIELKYPPPS